MTAEDHMAMVYIAGKKTLDESYFGFKFAMAPPFRLNYKLPFSLKQE